MMNEENLHVLWLNEGGNLEKEQTVPYQKSSTVRDFIYTLCSPIHHPPHKVRIWLSMKGSVDKTQKIYNSDGWKLLEDRKKTLEEYNVAPNETILVEKQSIDTCIWFFDKIAAEKQNNPQTVHHQVPQSSFMTPQLNSQFQHYQVSRQQAEMGRPPQDRSVHSSRIDDHSREMFYQMTDFPMGPSPAIYPMHSSGNRMMGGGYGGGHTHMGGGGGGGGGGFSHNEDEMLQEVLLMSLKEAKVQEEKKKEEEKKKKDYEDKVKEIQEFMRSSQKDSETTKKPDAAEIDEDYDYNEDEYNEEFDYADQQEGDENITEYNEEQGDENYAEEENTEGAQDQQEEYS